MRWLKNLFGLRSVSNSERKTSREKYKKESIFLLVLLPLSAVLWIIGVVIFVDNFNKDRSVSDLGVIAVESMYDFGSTNELDDNMEVLKTIMTPEVYERLTIDRTDRVLSVYLKFNNNPTKVLVEKSTGDYVIYSLKTESISSTRKFVFFYSINEKGKIDYVREAEIVDFSTNN